MVSSFVGSFAAGDIAIEEINAKGGILGRKLVKFEVDDAGSPTQQPIALRQLADEGINIVVGPVGSSQTLAALAVSTPAEMLHCGYITASEGGDGLRYPFHYQCSFTVASQAVLYADFLSPRAACPRSGCWSRIRPPAAAFWPRWKRSFRRAALP